MQAPSGRGYATCPPAGFTLLEMLVALVVFGLLLTALAQGVRLGMAALDRQSAALGDRAALDALDRTIRDLVGHIDPGIGRTTMLIDGQTDRFHFQSRLPAALAAPMRRAEMTLLVDERRRLVLRWTPAPHETPFAAPSAGTDTVLLDGIEGIELAYWSPRDLGGQPAGWRDAWDASYLPSLVRIRLRFADGDRRHWPEILVAPVLEQRG